MPVMGLSVEYQCDTTTQMTQDIRPWFMVSNTGSSSVDLSTLKVRYFFTADGSTGQTFVCDYADPNAGGNANVKGTFGTWTNPTTADTYLEVTFTAGTLAAGSTTGQVQARFHDTNYQVMFNQTNDYSFDPTKTSFTNWDHMTLYQNGTLVWGKEP
jgi:hypothetical protein